MLVDYNRYQHQGDIVHIWMAHHLILPLTESAESVVARFVVGYDDIYLHQAVYLMFQHLVPC